MTHTLKVVRESGKEELVGCDRVSLTPNKENHHDIEVWADGYVIETFHLKGGDAAYMMNDLGNTVQKIWNKDRK